MSKLYKEKSEVNGIGLFTSVSFKKGETVAYIHGPVHVFRTLTPKISRQTMNWIGVGKYSWINTEKSKFRYINHSCDPNTAQVTKRKVIALRDIAAGEELTLDYSLTEAEPGWLIPNCSCATKFCRDTISSITELPQSVYKKRKDYIPKNFQKIYENQ